MKLNELANWDAVHHEISVKRREGCSGLDALHFVFEKYGARMLLYFPGEQHLYICLTGMRAASIDSILFLARTFAGTYTIEARTSQNNNFEPYLHIQK
jgi:hypothetical protein